MTRATVSSPREVAAAIRTLRGSIVERWTQRVLEDPSVPEANRLPDPALRDHVPGVLQGIAQILECCERPGCDAEAEGRSLGRNEEARLHAANRHAQDYQLGHACRELSHLRFAILEALEHAGVEPGSDSIRAIASALDEAMRAAAEDMHAAATRDIQQAERALARQVALRERFVAILAHDLRGPLQTILVGARILAASEHEIAGARTLARILRAADRIGSMVSVLLDFSRIEHGQGIPVSLARTDARDVVDQAIDEAQAISPAIEIVLRAPPAVHGLWDAQRLVQVVSNLLRNAIEHGRGGPVVVVLECDDAWLQLSVRNPNGGTLIPQAVMEEMFEPFRSSDVGSRGLGLGLYIACAIVRAHHGTIRVESDLEATTFVVRLPRDTPAARAET